MITMPFAPLTPYRAVAVASLRMEKEAMSSTSTRSMLRSTPSTSTSGLLLLPNVFIPLIQKSAPLPGSDVLWRTTSPASLPARPEERFATGILSSSVETVVMAPITEAFLWVPYATTVTSSRAFCFDTIFTLRVVLFPTLTSWSSSPRNWNCRMSSGVTSMVNFPSRSVETPRVDPLTRTNAPATGMFMSSTTVPFTVLEPGVWA